MHSRLPSITSVHGAVQDVYFLTVHSPLEDLGAPAPVNGLIVHARTLLHPWLPQPDSGRIYRCLTEFPGRVPGCVVPLSTLNYELGDGRLWPQVADWQNVTRELVQLTRTPGFCEAILLALDQADATLLAAGPFTPVRAMTDHGVAVLGTTERKQLIAWLTSELPEATGEPRFWPGHGLIPPPALPATMPYQPYGT
jgi:hypothetical protein